MPGKNKGKKLVYVSDDVAKALLEFSAKIGVPLQKLVDEGLRGVLEMLKSGISPEELKTFIAVAKHQRASGLTLVPAEVLKHLEKNYNKSRESLEAVWREAGCWFGKYLKEKVEDPVNHLALLLKATRWDLDEVEVRNSNEIIFRCISQTLSWEETRYLRSFIEGAMNCLGYSTLSVEEVRGITIIRFRKS